jgi:hypothetical protein
VTTDFSAHYDGRVIVPDEPLALPIGEKLTVRVEHQDAQQVAYPNAPDANQGRDRQTLFDALNEAGLIGCITDGPVDLSTNPRHMEGFGASGD